MKRATAFVVGVASLALVASGCGLTEDEADGSPGVTDDKIVVGYLAPMSGPQESYGKPNFQLFQQEIDKINADGGIDGREIEVVVEDDQCSPDQGVRGARSLMQRDVFMHFGYTCSGVAAAAREVVGGTDIPVIVSSAAGPDTSREDDNVFYLTVSTSRQGRALVNYAADELEAQRVALLRSSDAYGELSQGAVKEMAEERGLEIVADEVSDTDATSISAQVGKIADSDPDVVILATYSNIAALYLAEAKAKGIGAPTLGMAATEQAIDLVSDESLLESFYSLTAFGDTHDGEGLGPVVEEFRTSYPEWRNKPIPQFTFLGYTEAALLKETLERIDGEPTREKMIEVLSEMKDWNPDAPVLSCPLDFTREHNEGETCSTLFKVGPDRQRQVIGPVDGA